MSLSNSSTGEAKEQIEVKPPSPKEWSMPSHLVGPLKQMRKLMMETPGLWDIVACMRGPDSPSERPYQSGGEQSKLHSARVARKMRTGAVIRGLSGISTGGAKTRSDITFVELPPHEEWDHYDKHIDRAAQVMGLKVVIKKEHGILSKEGKKAGVVVVEPAPTEPNTAFHTLSGKSFLTPFSAPLVKKPKLPTWKPGTPIALKKQLIGGAIAKMLSAKAKWEWLSETYPEHFDFENFPAQAQPAPVGKEGEGF